MTRCIIMAAGEGSRWGNHTGVPKHLIAPTGEPLITRLCRQLAERGHDDVVLLGPRDYRGHVPEHVRVVTPDLIGDDETWLGARKFANTIPHWSDTGRTIVFYGDIWLDDAAIDAILASTEREWLNWCRLNRHPRTGKAGENFAVSFYPEHHGAYREAMEIAVDTHRAGIINRSGGWEIARVMGGLRGRDIRKGSRALPCMRDVGHLGTGMSDDFDKPHDLDAWLRHYVAEPRFDLGPRIRGPQPYALLRHCLKLDLSGAHAVEFGVGKGVSTRFIAAHMPVFGFGSTKGLPEDWRPGFPRGRFAYQLPHVPNAHLFEGLFEDTLPRFDFGRLDIGLVHLDADLYSATACALEHIGKHLRPGCVLVFDEFHSYPGFERHEERAWAEFAERTGVTWQPIGHTDQEFALRLT